MRFAAALLCCLVAGEAAAAPLLRGRVGQVARGELPPDVIGSGAHDGRALVTARVRGGADTLRRAGFVARALSQSVAELRLTPFELRRLIAHPDVLVIEERRLLHPMLDQSAAAIGAPVARLLGGVDGSGVLIGVVDTGVDFRHADLRNADGTTRIGALLDVANARTLHPELPDYNGAAVWLRDDIDALLSAEAAGQTSPVQILEADSNGHGTHVTGIAASNGRATANGLPAGRYVGIAPGAALVVAQATHGGNTFTDGDVLTGCQFALDEAAREGAPLVLNLSLGGSGGPHDGTSDLEAALDELFPYDMPGRVLVIAAGNEGNLDRHAGGWALDGAADVTLSVPIALPQSQLSLEVWYLGSLSIEIDSPTGASYGPVAQGQSLSGGNGQIAIDNGASGGPGQDGRQGATITVTGPTGGALATGTWTIRLRGRSGRWDAWIVDEPGPDGVTRFVAPLSEDDRLSLPATAHDAIIVGAFVTRNSWTTRSGEMVKRSARIGDTSDFSPAGPTSDGRFAPDLLAPGESIISALSSDAPPTSSGSAFYTGGIDPDFAIADDGLHGVLRGTSQAAPHVTGTLALLLQANPALTSQQLREILRATARDGGRGFTPRTGFGKLDALAALRYVTGNRGDTVNPTTSSVGVSRDMVPPGSDLVLVTVTPRSADGTPIGPRHHVAITASAGSPYGGVVDAGEGRYERAFMAQAPRGSIATISASVDGIELSAHPRVYFVVSRAEIGQQLAAHGGCSASRSTTIPAGTLIVILLLGLVRTIKSRRRRLGRTLCG